MLTIALSLCISSSGRSWTMQCSQLWMIRIHLQSGTFNWYAVELPPELLIVLVVLFTVLCVWCYIFDINHFFSLMSCICGESLTPTFPNCTLVVVLNSFKCFKACFLSVPGCRYHHAIHNEGQLEMTASAQASRFLNTVSVRHCAACPQSSLHQIIWTPAVSRLMRGKQWCSSVLEW